MNEKKVVAPASVGSSKENAFKSAQPNRRDFFSWLTLGWVAYLGGYWWFFHCYYSLSISKRTLRTTTNLQNRVSGRFSSNSVDIKYKKEFNAWIVRDEESIFALSTVCTHLGCTPNWLPAESKFKCPCHGSGFRMTGIHFEGPAPRPLERFKIGLANDGQILVDKTKSFKWEKGEWENPESFLKV